MIRLCIRSVRVFTEASGPVAKQLVDVAVVACEGSPLRTTWTCGGTVVTVESSLPLGAARKQGLSAELAREQLGRLGNTAYSLGELGLEVQGNPFVQASLLNQLRRDAVERLQAAQTASRQIEVRDPLVALKDLLPSRPVASVAVAPELHLLIRTPEQLESALALGAGQYYA